MNIQLDYQDTQIKFAWQLSGEDFSCAPLEMVLLAAIGKRNQEVLPRLLADHGGGGISDYLAFHFESVPELGILVAKDHVLCADYFGTVTVPRLLFYGLLRELLQADRGQVAGSDLQQWKAALDNLLLRYQGQGDWVAVTSSGRTQVTYAPSPEGIVCEAAPHLMEEIRAASLILAAPSDFETEVGRTNARQRFVAALRRAGLLGELVPQWFMASLPEADAEEMRTVIHTYHRLVQLLEVVRADGHADLTFSDLYLACDWFLHVGDWAVDDRQAFDFSVELVTGGWAGRISKGDHSKEVVWEGWRMAVQVGDTGPGSLGLTGASCTGRIEEEMDEVEQEYT